MRGSRTLSLALGLLGALGPAAGCGGTEPSPDASASFRLGLLGTWRSVAPERVVREGGPVTWRQRVFVLRERDFHLSIDVFADAEGRQPLMRLEFEGPWSVGRAAPTVPGAFEAEFGHDAWWITPLSEGLAQTLSSTGCGSGTWKAGDRQEVSERGCLGIASRHDCPREYDIVALVDGRLTFGERVVTPCRPELRLSRLSPTDRFERAP